MDRKLMAVDPANLFSDQVWLSLTEVAVFEKSTYQTVRLRANRIADGEGGCDKDPLCGAVVRVGGGFRVDRKTYGEHFGPRFEEMVSERREAFVAQQIAALEEMVEARKDQLN